MPEYSPSPATELLAKQIRASDGPSLVVVDETLGLFDPPAVNPAIEYLCNRIDIARHLEVQGHKVTISDYHFSDCSTTAFERVIYRIGKDKAQVHHIINQAGNCLPDEGQLCLIGHKNEGLTTYARKAQALLGGVSNKSRGDKGFTEVITSRYGPAGESLPCQDYATLRQQVTYGDLQFYSKPGIYGWNKIDQGSRLLVGFLPQLAGKASTILDLGCGYGYISACAATALAAKVTAIDNNVAAVAACQRNFDALEVNGSVVLDDCARSLDQRFDLILCNPPFHQGFDTSTELTDRFLTETRAHLKPGGQALFVVNQFIGLEKRASTLFSRCDEVARSAGFKLLLLS